MTHLMNGCFNLIGPETNLFFFCIAFVTSRQLKMADGLIAVCEPGLEAQSVLSTLLLVMQG